MARTTEHKEGKASVTIIYRTAKTLADGSHPFWVRITKDRKSKFVATGLSLHPQYWNAEKSKIRSSYPSEEKNWRPLFVRGRGVTRIPRRIMPPVI